MACSSTQSLICNRVMGIDRLTAPFLFSIIPIPIKNHSLMYAEMRGGKDAQNLTQGRREAETQSREEGRSDTSGEALRSIAFYKQTGDKRGAGKRARCSAVKTNIIIAILSTLSSSTCGRTSGALIVSYQQRSYLIPILNRLPPAAFWHTRF